MRRDAALQPGAPASDRPVQPDDHWRHVNIGRLLSNALRQFEARVIELLAEAGHDEITTHHINATRHLDVSGTRLTEMARRAAVTKQSMSELVVQLEGLGIVARKADPLDGRARIVHFTSRGLVWLNDFRQAVERAEHEMAERIGSASLRDVKKALSAYERPEE